MTEARGTEGGQRGSEGVPDVVQTGLVLAGFLRRWLGLGLAGLSPTLRALTHTQSAHSTDTVSDWSEGKEVKAERFELRDRFFPLILSTQILRCALKCIALNRSVAIRTQEKTGRRFVFG